MARSFFERRGNFDNITLVAVTEAQAKINILPNNFEKVAPVSKIVPNTYEVNSSYCKNMYCLLRQNNYAFISSLQLNYRMMVKIQ